MNPVFIIASSICLLAALIFTIVSARKKHPLSKYTSTIFLSAFFVLLFYSLTFFTDYVIFTKAAYSLKFLSEEAFLCLLTNLMLHIGYVSFDEDLINKSNLLFLVFAGIDFGLMMINLASDYYFKAVPYFSVTSNYLTWHIQPSNLFIYHMGIVLLLSVTIINFGCKLIKKSLSFYAHKYIYILAEFLLLLATACISIKFFIYDFSAFLSIFIAFHIFYLVYYAIPKEDFRCLLSLSSENADFALSCFDRKGNCTYSNEAAKTIFGKSDWGKISAECFAKKLDLECSRIRRRSTSFEDTFMISEVPHYMKVQYQQFYDKRNRFTGSYVMFEDRTDAVKRYEIEKYRSSHDKLTGLYNRNTFFEKAAKLIQEHPDSKRYMVATNIRNFKLINEVFGTEFADKVLQTQASMLLLAKQNDENALIARVGGDKFAMFIAHDKFNPELALENTKKIQQLTQKYNFRFQMYIGVYDVTNPYERVSLMYDKACMAITNIHGNYDQSISYYDQFLMDHLKKQKSVLDEFNQAVAEGQYVMYLQPQINCKTGKISGAEALVRRFHPVKGLIPPSEFISILEDAGFIYLLDQFIWEEAAKKLSEWKTLGLNLTISINISAKDFYYCDIYKILTELVKKYDIEPQKLNIEITETIFMHEVSVHKQVLSMLKSFGFSIEMDDFGSGYSSLNALNELKMDVLKIDMEFLHKTQNTERSKLILKAIIDMAKNLGMTVITEGVETEEQVKFLTEIGTDIIQGYFYSKPISVKEFEEKYLPGAER